MIKGLIIVNPYGSVAPSVHHAHRMKEELNKRGVEIEIVSDGFSRVAIEGQSAQVDLSAPDFAVYLDKDKYLSEILEKGGLRLFNRHEAVRVCDDKGQTYIALAGHGIKFPKTVFGALCYSKDSIVKKEWAEKIARTLGFPIIVKESFGSMGKGVYKADDLDELFDIMQQVKLKPHLFQEYLGEKVGVDVRVIVIGGKAVAAMERHNSEDFRSNIGQGGYGEKIELSPSFKQVAEKCANVLGLDYCGVDLLYGKNGEPYVCEVNSNAFIDGIEKVTGVNVAGCYADYIISTVQKERG